MTESGALAAYQPASGPGSPARLRLDRDARRLGNAWKNPRNYGDIALSPARLVARSSQRAERRSHTRGISGCLTSRAACGDRRPRLRIPSDDVAAAWSPDSNQLVFASNRAGHFDLDRKAAAGIGSDELIFQHESEKDPTAMVAWMAVRSWTGCLAARVAQVHLLDPWRLTSIDWSFVGPPATRCDFSGDGRWAAYSSTESGRFEVYVEQRLLPSPSRNRQLSNAGRQPAAMARRRATTSCSTRAATTGSRPRRLKCAALSCRYVARRRCSTVPPGSARVRCST